MFFGSVWQIKLAIHSFWARVNTVYHIVSILLLLSQRGFFGCTEQSVCQSEYFRAKCSSVDEVLMVRSALYGRMHISKCVKENFGFIGCSTDVLDLVDAQCSGRRECSMRILDENFGNAKPCHDDLKTYLQVNYRCVKGELVSYTPACIPRAWPW